MGPVKKIIETYGNCDHEVQKFLSMFHQIYNHIVNRKDILNNAKIHIILHGS